MARPRVDAALAALARRRVDFSSAHFGLAYQASQPTPGPEGAAQRGHRPSSMRQLAISVPKRQLRRAVDRNMMKRVAREAWRLADWSSQQSCSPGLQAMLKLRRAEPEWKTMGRAALKKAWRLEIDALVVQLQRRLLTTGRQVAQ